MVDHHIEAHFQVKANVSTTANDRERRVQERAVELMTDVLLRDAAFSDRVEAGKYARMIVLGLGALPQVLQQAIADVDGG